MTDKQRTYSTVRVSDEAGQEVDKARLPEKRTGANQVAWIVEQWAQERRKKK